jgi:hypothetical protein
MNACARIVVLALAGLLATPAMAQDKAGKRDDLDVTMQIIVDPNAKLPDEVVRQIPLPTSRANSASAAKPPPTPEAATKGKERAQEARELGNEAADTAKEKGRESAQQREEARNSNAKDRGKDNAPPDRPNPPRPRP